MTLICLKFKIANFSSPSSLENFAKGFGVTKISKDLWPYLHYKSIAEITSAVTFPPIHVFSMKKIENAIEELKEVYNSKPELLNLEMCLNYFGIDTNKYSQDELSSNKLVKLDEIQENLKISPLAYALCKDKFDNNIESGLWTSMLDMLRQYNLVDCHILQEAWKAYCDSFYKELDVDVQLYMSLSQLAQTILFKYYPAESSPVMTIGQKFTWLNKEIRSNLCGGLSAVFHRHASIKMNPKYPKSVFFTPNNSRIRKICQLDINSLYPFTMQDDMPTGSGILYLKEKESFVMHPLIEQYDGNASQISFHWLNYMQGKFIDENGKKNQIQCALNGKEKSIGNYKLDGYVEYKGKKVGLDFRGCRYHPCASCNTKFIGTAEEEEADLIRDQFLRKNLDEYYVESECIYRKNMSKNNPPLLCTFFNSQDISSNDILNAILQDRAFGLLKCDIITPENAQKKYVDLNFPPIFRHVQVTRDMLTSDYCEVADRKKKKFPLKEQLTLTFNANGIVLASPLVKYYIQNGLVVTNVYYFVEYIPDKVFKPFVNEMVKMRVQATIDDNSQRQNLSKLMMNSSWGRLAMNVSKRKNIRYIRSEEMQKHKSLFVRNVDGLHSEYEVDLLELTKDKKSIIDSIPGTL